MDSPTIVMNIRKVKSLAVFLKIVLKVLRNTIKEKKVKYIVIGKKKQHSKCMILLLIKLNGRKINKKAVTLKNKY